MNLAMASVLLLAMLAFQPTLIYGSKGSPATSVLNRGRDKRTVHASAASARLLLSLESGGDVVLRATRGASSDSVPAAVAGNISGSGAGKRNKNNSNNNNNNRKLNKNSGALESGAPAGRKHLDKKFSAAAAANQQQQKPQQQQQHGGNKANGNNKQRQLLKSQQHQGHGKRSGSKSKAEKGEKSADGAKSQSTCRYAKSVWTECDAKTNMRSRTLTLKKGEANCLPTRTMEKKCKKSCRYEKGSWTECSNGQMTRLDKLKSTGSASSDSSSSSSCEPMRSINKKCNPGGGAGKHQGGGKANKERKNKEKASRRGPPQAAPQVPA